MPFVNLLYNALCTKGETFNVKIKQPIIEGDCMKLLLTSVFGPYGVDDEYGEQKNKMELFHNQVTREQGIFSYRFNHGSQGLYFLAENPVPLWARQYFQPKNRAPGFHD